MSREKDKITIPGQANSYTAEQWGSNAAPPAGAVASERTKKAKQEITNSALRISQHGQVAIYKADRASTLLAPTLHLAETQR